MRFLDLPDIALQNIFSPLSSSRNILNLRLVCSVFKAQVEDNTKLALEGNYEGPCSYKAEKSDIRLIIIGPSLELPRARLNFNSNSNQFSVADLGNSQLSNCIKKVSLQFDYRFKQTIELISDVASILNHQTDFAISCTVKANFPKASLIQQSGESLSELIPSFKLVSFDIYCQPPFFPDFTADLIKFYLKNSNNLQKLKLNSIDVFETVLRFLIETGQVWPNLKCLDIQISSSQNITSGGLPTPEVVFSQHIVQTFSDPRITQKIPNVAEIKITTADCAIDLNGLANLKNLKSITLQFDVFNLKQEGCNLVFKPGNFRQMVKSVENLSFASEHSNILTRQFDFILEQYPFLRHLVIALYGDSDQNYLISSITRGSLAQLESLDIAGRGDGVPSVDNQLHRVFCSDSISICCPKLTKLSIRLSDESNLAIIQNCSESINQLTVSKKFGKCYRNAYQSMLNQLIGSLDSNQYVESITYNVEGYTEDFEQVFKKFSINILENRNDHNGMCLIKFKDTQHLGSLMWKNKYQKRRKMHFDVSDYGFGSCSSRKRKRPLWESRLCKNV
jgi:hypothetical protein